MKFPPLDFSFIQYGFDKFPFTSHDPFLLNLRQVVSMVTESAVVFLTTARTHRGRPFAAGRAPTTGEPQRRHFK